MGGTAIIFKALNGATSKTAGEDGGFQGYTDSYQPLKPCASWCALDEFAEDVATGFGVDNSKQTIDSGAVKSMSSTVAKTTKLSEYGGICGRVLRIDGLLQTYDELHNRQYGTIQEIWVQLQYAYQETMDNSERVTDNADARDRVVQSPFPNVFFSAPEGVDIRGFCPSSNMKCRGYMTDQHQPYGGSRNHVERVHWNNEATRSTDAKLAFGANQVKPNPNNNKDGTPQSGNDWTIDRDYRGDSTYPSNYHSYKASNGESYGGGAAGTTYSGRDYNHTPYIQQGMAGKK